MTRFIIIALITAFMQNLFANEWQMLLPESEQQKILSTRNYPPNARQRLSAKAAQAGYAALARKELNNAMQEFNRAWRFNPQNIDAYWGAAIVSGLQAETTAKASEAQKRIENSLKLFKLAEKYLSGNRIEKENYQLDYAASCYAAGVIMLKSEKTSAEKYFAEAEKLWLPLLKDRNLQKQRDFMVYYRTCWHLTKLYRDWGKTDLYQKYLNILPEAVRKKL